MDKIQRVIVFDTLNKMINDIRNIYANNKEDIIATAKGFNCKADDPYNEFELMETDFWEAESDFEDWVEGKEAVDQEMLDDQFMMIRNMHREFKRYVYLRNQGLMTEGIRKSQFGRFESYNEYAY